MLREILEKLNQQEALCREAKELMRALSSGSVTLKNSAGDEFLIDKNSGIIGGHIFGQNNQGKDVSLDICGNEDFRIV